jgi:prevent-host-death family protein
MYFTVFCMKVKEEISSTEAVRNFGDCLARVRYGGETLIITKGNKPVAELRPIETKTKKTKKPKGTFADLLRIWKPDPNDPGFADDLERANSKDIAENPWDS